MSALQARLHSYDVLYSSDANALSLLLLLHCTTVRSTRTCHSAFHRDLRKVSGCSDSSSSTAAPVAQQQQQQEPETVLMLSPECGVCARPSMPAARYYAIALTTTAAFTATGSALSTATVSALLVLLLPVTRAA
jgi:hypothetical protein